MENITELLKGVLEGCILEIISQQETYGYEITRKLNALGFEDVVDGTVYTILVRLEKNGWIVSTKRPSEVGPPRKFYALSLQGQKERALFWEKWSFVSSRMQALKEEQHVVLG